MAASTPVNAREALAQWWQLRSGSERHVLIAVGAGLLVGVLFGKGGHH